MAAEVRLIIAKKEARLLLKSGDDVLEDELWKFEGAPLSPRQAVEMARLMFDECYDFMQFSVHGDA